MIIKLIDEAVKSGARKHKACEIAEINIRNLQRWKDNLYDKRSMVKKTPKNKLSVEEEAKIVSISCSKEFRDLSPNEIVPLLADQGTFVASERTFYRVLGREELLKHRGRARAPTTRKRPKTFVATGPNQVWSWDITYLKSPVTGIFYYLYLIMDVWSRKIVGFEVHEVESASFASKLFVKTVENNGVRPEKLVLHSDNGAPMRGETMVATLERLGVLPSFSRPRVSDDNPFSEALFRTLKYRPGFPSKPFQDLEAAQKWVVRFAHWYNNSHLHSGIKFVTPNDRHEGRDVEILTNRKKIYAAAKEVHPERWSGEPRCWDRQEEVTLNQPRQLNKLLEEAASVLFSGAAHQVLKRAA